MVKVAALALAAKAARRRKRTEGMEVVDAIDMIVSELLRAVYEAWVEFGGRGMHL